MATLLDRPLPDNWLSNLLAGNYSVTWAVAYLRFSRRHVRSYARLRDVDGKAWSRRPYRRERALRFHDLMELRIARACHDLGMPWREICNIARYEAEPFGERGHRLSHQKFLNGGHTRISRLLLDTGDVTAPIDYDEYGIPIRWNISREWGIETPEAAVVLDPCLSFGSPIMAECRVPTYILHDALLAEDGDYCTVAQDYEVSVAEVRLAYRFETILQGKDALLD